MLWGGAVVIAILVLFWMIWRRRRRRRETHLQCGGISTVALAQADKLAQADRLAGAGVMGKGELTRLLNFPAAAALPDQSSAGPEIDICNGVACRLLPPAALPATLNHAACAGVEDGKSGLADDASQGIASLGSGGMQLPVNGGCLAHGGANIEELLLQQLQQAQLAQQQLLAMLAVVRGPGATHEHVL